jgi:hypothetical protein
VRRKTRRPWILQAAALLTVIAFPPPEARAGRLPDWAKQISEAAPAVPAGVPESATRVLLNEMRYDTRPDGTFEIRQRLALQALSANRDGVDTGWFHFDERVKITASRAWHLSPDDSARRSRSAPVDVTVGESFLSGQKVRLLPVEGVKKGSLVFFEFEAVDRPPFLALAYLFFENSPASIERLELLTPPGWTVRWSWLRGKGPDPAINGDLRTWEIRNLPAPLEEPLGPAPDETAPMLALNILPPPGVAVRPATFPDWISVSGWLEDLSRGRDLVTPPIQAALKDAISGEAESALDRITALALFVRDRVRYVAMDLGVSGYQPRPAEETLASLYGDCKDKATLFRSLLAAAGMDSYPVVVNSVTRETVPEDPPYPGFNHMVVAVPLPAGATLPPGLNEAAADAGDLGRLLIVDVTNENTSIGAIPAGLAGKRALVAAGPKSRLLTLPEGSPSSHSLVRQLQVELLPDRTVGVGRTSVYGGEFAAMVREEARASARERRQAVEHAMKNQWPGAVVEDYSVESEDSEGRLTEKIRFRHGPLPATGPDARIALFPGATADLERAPLANRKTAVDYRFPRTIRHEVVLKGLPPRAGFPDPEVISGDGWRVETSYGRDGDLLRAAWELRLSRTRFAPEAFPELRKMWSAVSTTASWGVRLAE